MPKRTQGGSSQEVSKRWLGSQKSWPNLRTCNFDRDAILTVGMRVYERMRRGYPFVVWSDQYSISLLFSQPRATSNQETIRTWDKRSRHSNMKSANRKARDRQPFKLERIREESLFLGILFQRTKTEQIAGKYQARFAAAEMDRKIENIASNVWISDYRRCRCFCTIP